MLRVRLGVDAGAGCCIRNIAWVREDPPRSSLANLRFFAPLMVDHGLLAAPDEPDPPDEFNPKDVPSPSNLPGPPDVPDPPDLLGTPDEPDPPVVLGPPLTSTSGAVVRMVTFIPSS
uniref:(northern house mosquito) hypothetical protein n=1 Tax=Culex pipiens TaxID=7175 RepID=A0A8D8FQB2_CULPI